MTVDLQDVADLKHEAEAWKYMLETKKAEGLGAQASARILDGFISLATDYLSATRSKKASNAT